MDESLQIVLQALILILGKWFGFCPRRIDPAGLTPITILIAHVVVSLLLMLCEGAIRRHLGFSPGFLSNDLIFLAHKAFVMHREHFGHGIVFFLRHDSLAALKCRALVGRGCPRGHALGLVLDIVAVSSLSDMVISPKVGHFR